MSTTPLISLGHVRAGDAMHGGIITADPNAPLRTVAAQMASYHVHAVVVADSNNQSDWALVTALDIAGAAASGNEATAGEVAATEIVTVSSDERLDHAAQLMAEHELSHLVVVDRATGRPVGILSALDIASVYADEQR